MHSRCVIWAIITYKCRIGWVLWCWWTPINFYCLFLFRIIQVLPALPCWVCLIWSYKEGKNKINRLYPVPTNENVVKYQCQNSQKNHCFANVLIEWRTTIITFAKQFWVYVISFANDINHWNKCGFFHECKSSPLSYANSGNIFIYNSTLISETSQLFISHF